jgi:glycosyltransferase involved in cell wall biosynthesis
VSHLTSGFTRRRVLYLTYDGLTDPLGQSQVLPYLKGLAARGHSITIISCEKAEARAVRGEAVAAECQKAGIVWHALPYRKRPPVLSTLLDLSQMRRLAVRLNQQSAFDIVHCRSYLTALTGRALQRRAGVRFVFDMRGFWIDERIERGIWPRGHLVYRAIAAWFRQREQELFAGADAIVSLTQAARSELARRGGKQWAEKTRVIPCCVDLAHFDPRGSPTRTAGRALLGLSADTPVLLYLGSLGGAYPLAPVLRFFRSWAQGRSDARLLFVTRHLESEIRSDRDAAELGEQIIIRAAERNQVPLLVATADAGLSFILPSFCAIASSPTMVGELLALGVPVAANDGVGDMALIMGEPAAGLLLADLSDAAVDAGASAMRVLTTEASATRAVAERWFALEGGIDTYDSIYRSLAPRTKCDHKKRSEKLANSVCF